MELTYNKCWDGKKHNWEAQHGAPYGWQAWCSKCGCMALFKRKYVIAGRWEVVKNSNREPIFTVPEYLKQASH